ncbi:OsmC family protein [Agilicoccus flavus]|uniref:OsmC family protein n=1 Tax=Agilicoccus flavus TaxID=2775968 RepID=UPI001CF6C0ED|nr:OsmC family protein [Agilicoccus flavus]
MTDAHEFAASAVWQGTTGAGYEAYDRGHEVRVGPNTLRVSSDRAFRGDPGLLNPEQLLVVAASSCQLLSFLAVAARARVDVVSYRDDARGFMPHEGRPMWVSRIELRPHVVVASDVTDERLAHLVEVAHRECFVAASLRSEIELTPTFERV